MSLVFRWSGWRNVKATPKWWTNEEEGRLSATLFDEALFS
jgi:hypothetical protein